MHEDITLKDISELLQVQVITQMRIYDAMVALLREANPETAQRVIDLHEDFKYVGPMPFAEDAKETDA